MVKTVKIVYRFQNMTSDRGVAFIEKLHAVGALSVTPDGDGNTYILVATFPAVNYYA